uniref:Uncharacterized protein n=1 Tax=Oryza sativa subsp. japonica TaxID=39947 RepID=Q5VP36_ORYSJ|nr:hypothetical protein [Oryza sativa Japonica Group]BAD68789.1 hypothetical protein [Oryza sativa Japonica Group]
MGKSIFQRAKATAEHIAPVTSPAVSSGESDGGGGGASRRPRSTVVADLSVVDERPDSTAMTGDLNVKPVSRQQLKRTGCRSYSN